MIHANDALDSQFDRVETSFSAITIFITTAPASQQARNAAKPNRSVGAAVVPDASVSAKEENW